MGYFEAIKDFYDIKKGAKFFNKSWYDERHTTADFHPVLEFPTITNELKCVDHPEIFVWVPSTQAHLNKILERDKENIISKIRAELDKACIMHAAIESEQFKNYVELNTSFLEYVIKYIDKMEVIL